MNDRRPLHRRLDRLEALLGCAGHLADCPVCAGVGTVGGPPPSMDQAEIARPMRARLDRDGPAPEQATNPVPRHAVAAGAHWLPPGRSACAWSGRRYEADCPRRSTPWAADLGDTGLTEATHSAGAPRGAGTNGRRTVKPLVSAPVPPGVRRQSDCESCR